MVNSDDILQSAHVSESNSAPNWRYFCRQAARLAGLPQLECQVFRRILIFRFTMASRIWMRI